MFKISKCDVPKPLHALFNNSYHNYQTRKNESIHVPIGMTEAYYKTFSYFGAHIWNRIFNNFQQMCLILPLNIYSKILYTK